MMEFVPEDEWCIDPSDDELVADCIDPTAKYFTPKDPEEIKRLYKLVAENGIIELCWKNPGKIETEKRDLKDDLETSKEEENHKEDLNEFDFDEPTPAISLSFRKQKQAKAPTQRKVASFDKIMNDITKGGKGIRKDPTKSSKKQRKLKVPKSASKNSVAFSIKLEKTKLDTEEGQQQDQLLKRLQPQQQVQPAQQQELQQQQQQLSNPQGNQQQIHQQLPTQPGNQQQVHQQLKQQQQQQQVHPSQFQHQAQFQQQQPSQLPQIQQQQVQQQIQQQQVHHHHQQQPMIQQNLLKQMLVPPGHESQMSGQQQPIVGVMKQIPPQHLSKQEQQMIGHSQRLPQNLPGQQQVLMGQQDPQQPQIQTALHQGPQQQQQYTLIQQQQQQPPPQQQYQQIQSGVRSAVAMRSHQNSISVQQQQQPHVYHHAGGVPGGNLKIQGQLNSQQGQISVQHLPSGQQIQVHHRQHIEQPMQQNVQIQSQQPNLLKQMLIPSGQEQNRQQIQQVHLQSQQQQIVMASQQQQQHMPQYRTQQVAQPVVLQQTMQLHHQSGQQQYAVQVQQHQGGHDQYTPMQIGVRGQTTTMRQQQQQQQQISMSRPQTQINLQQQLYHTGTGTMIRVGQPNVNNTSS